MNTVATTPLTPAEYAEQKKQVSREGYVNRSLVAIDQCINVITGGNPDETISSRLARAAERGSRFGILGSKFLNLFQPNHGVGAQAGDVERAEAVISVEQSSGALPK